MAKEKQVRKSVNLTAPNGTRVTVGEDVKDKYTVKGYKAASASK